MSHGRRFTRALLACLAVAGVTTACSLVVDTSGLSGGSGPGPNADGATADGPTGTDAALDDRVVPPDGSSEASNGCPSGRGPTMIAITAPPARFCIDTTEVTRGQYRAFLDSVPDVATQPAECSWNSTFVPSTITLDPPDLPVVKVDWCDARAFCAWAGKRLCGALGTGAAITVTDAVEPTKSEWMFACSRGGTRGYPYGPSPANGVCNDVTASRTDAVTVGSLAGCTGGFAGLFDMVGNISEWENACVASGVGDRTCVNRGSSWVSEGRCSYASADDYKGTSSDWGIRCCADLP